MIGNELLCCLALHLVAPIQSNAFEDDILTDLEKGVKLGNYRCIPPSIITGDVSGCERILCIIPHAIEYHDDLSVIVFC